MLVPANLSMCCNGFNRTFMELKLSRIRWKRYAKKVLIVPLWNWNDKTTSAPTVTLPSFNRTFMELKLATLLFTSWTLLVLIVPLWNWNAARSTKEIGMPRVLIVPLWNWNYHECLLAKLPFSVLIVPLWNWNNCLLAQELQRTRFNRTFMELKFNKLMYDNVDNGF